MNEANKEYPTHYFFHEAHHGLPVLRGYFNYGIKRKAQENEKHGTKCAVVQYCYSLRDETLTGSNHNWSIDFRVTSTFLARGLSP